MLEVLGLQEKRGCFGGNAQPQRPLLQEMLWGHHQSSPWLLPALGEHREGQGWVCREVLVEEMVPSAGAREKLRPHPRFHHHA